MVDEVGSAREAFEPRGSRELRRQDDRQDGGGNKVLRRQDDEHDEGGKKQTERQGEVVRRQPEDDMQQDGDDRGRGAGVQKSGGDGTREDKDEKRGEMGKGVCKG